MVSRSHVVKREKVWSRGFPALVKELKNLSETILEENASFKEASQRMYSVIFKVVIVLYFRIPKWWNKETDFK